MKLLLLSGNFPKKSEEEVLKNSKKSVQFAANIFQWNLIEGFRNELNTDFYLISAPFINSYPNGYRKMFYSGKTVSSNEVYVSFFNLFGIRNFFRYHSLKIVSKYFLDVKDNNKYIIVYSPHVPLLKTACYLKKIDPSIKIILLLPDLPQFVSLSEKKSIIYKLLKPFDIKMFYKYSIRFDKYILLTKEMNNIVNVKNKPSIVVEGIVNTKTKSKKGSNSLKIISYTGTLDKAYGINHLLNAFLKIEDKNFRLIICGKGDSENYIKKCIMKDERISFLGQVSSEESKKIQINSTVLVNPRQNVGLFTKYSFPSKNLEYLSTGNPVIAYKLDGIPGEYSNILFIPSDNSIKSLKEKIVYCANLSNEELTTYRNKLHKFIKQKGIINTTKKILNFIYSEGENE